MGLTTRLETENRTGLQSVEDPRNLLHRALPRPEDPGFHWAGTIDWYGDTTFNHLQVPKLRAEWQRLIEASQDSETIGLLRQIDELLKRCLTEQPQVYVRFVGD
jgi:hypothetical protein